MFSVNSKYLKILRNSLNYFAGLRKKLVAAAAKKDNTSIRPWIPSIVNQLYWAATTSNGDGNQAIAKWRSMKNHIADVHVHHDPDYPMCQHEPLENRAWIEKGNIAKNRVIKGKSYRKILLNNK